MTEIALAARKCAIPYPERKLATDVRNGTLLANTVLIDQAWFSSRNFRRKKDYMKTVNDQIGHIEQADFDRFIAAYPDLDTAARLSADYCITVGGFTALTREIQTRMEQKSSRTLIRRSNSAASPSLGIQSSGLAQRQVERLKNYQRVKKGWWKRFLSTLNNRFDGGGNSKPSQGGLAFE